MERCPTCGYPNPPENETCDSCGSPLPHEATGPLPDADGATTILRSSPFMQEDEAEGGTDVSFPPAMPRSMTSPGHHELSPEDDEPPAPRAYPPTMDHGALLGDAPPIAAPGTPAGPSGYPPAAGGEEPGTGPLHDGPPAAAPAPPGAAPPAASGYPPAGPSAFPPPAASSVPPETRVGGQEGLRVSGPSPDDMGFSRPAGPAQPSVPPQRGSSYVPTEADDAPDLARFQRFGGCRVWLVLGAAIALLGVPAFGAGVGYWLFIYPQGGQAVIGADDPAAADPSAPGVRPSAPPPSAGEADGIEPAANPPVGDDPTALAQEGATAEGEALGAGEAATEDDAVEADTAPEGDAVDGADPPSAQDAGDAPEDDGDDTPAGETDDAEDGTAPPVQAEDGDAEADATTEPATDRDGERAGEPARTPVDPTRYLQVRVRRLVQAAARQCQESGAVAVEAMVGTDGRIGRSRVVRGASGDPAVARCISGALIGQRVTTSLPREPVNLTVQVN
ncbi:MAG: hypothetical protein ACFCGT_13625 [Sandaracinaceae bacterium]